MKSYHLILGTLAAATFLSTSFGSIADQPVKEKPSAVVVETTTMAKKSIAVNTASSLLNWNAKKVGGEHSGTIKILKGALEVDNSKVVGGNFVIDMATIENTDVTNATFNQKLVDHLKSDDFFSVERNPTAVFTITKAVPVKAKAGEANYTITGDLAIKGITHSITFPATINLTDQSAEATAKIELDRIKWDIKYRSGLIGTAADKIIDDTFTIDLKLVAGGKSKQI